MKCNKTFLAVAIAGIAAAPMIASADTTLSGVVQIMAIGSDADDDSGDIKIVADDVLFGIASEHAMNSGLTGYGSLRVDMNRLSNEGSFTDDNGTVADEDDDEDFVTLGSADSVYVGFKGGFGDMRFGEIPNAVEVGQTANDIYDVTGEVNGGISYTGSFGPAGIVANFSPEQNSDMIGLGATFGLGGFSFGVGFEDKAEREAIAAGVSFAYAGASIAANFWTADGGGANEQESFTVKVGYGFGGVSANLTLAHIEDAGTREADAVRLDLVYDLGGGFDISSRITMEDDQTPDAVTGIEPGDLTSYRVKLSKAF